MVLFFCRRCEDLSKRNNDWSKQKLERYLKEGRGKGDFASYKPWLTVQDFPSSGRASRILGNKTKRVHHFFSDLETQCFYLWDWDQKVIDIKEHYPLLNLYDVVDVKDINVNAFKDKYTNEPYVITTTFLILVRTAEGGIDCFARSVKYKSGLEKTTTMEKLELERRYWKAQGADWAIITEDDIPKEKAKNIQWFHGVLNEYKNYDIDEKSMVRLCGEFLDYTNSSDLSIRKLAKDFEVKNSLKEGTGIFIFKYLLAARVVEIDMNKSIDLNLTFSEITK